MKATFLLLGKLPTLAVLRLLVPFLALRLCLQLLKHCVNRAFAGHLNFALNTRRIPFAPIIKCFGGGAGIETGSVMSCTLSKLAISQCVSDSILVFFL